MTNPIEWKAIPGYEGWYEASRCGKVRSLKWWHPRWGTIIDKVHELAPLWYRKGYYKVQLGTCGNTRPASRQYIHRVIYRTFHGEIPDGMTVNHIDGTHDNNHADNLELLTHAGQHHHARALGMLRNKTKTGHKKPHLTPNDVAAIRITLAASTQPLSPVIRILAGQYGVHPATIHDIKTRHTWKHI